MWTIEKIISKGEYNYCIVRNHPNKTKNDYVLHHRVIVENHIDRVLDCNEIVHHINGDKKDNRIDNLKIMNQGEHAILHGSKKLSRYVDFICPMCKTKFTRRYDKTHLGKKQGDCTCCSRSCGTRLGRLKQLGRIDHEMKLNIKNNVICIYQK